MNISNRAKEIMSSMTTEEKVGQLFVARCPRENAADEIAKYSLGGYTLYGVDFQSTTPDAVRANIKSYIDASKIPPFIAVDEEGGRVVRASLYPEFRPEPFKSPQALYAEGGLNRIVEDVKEKSEFLHSFGINFNYAPVCDMSTSPDNFIYHRTLGQGAKETAAYAEAVVRTMNECKMIGSIKHFPGYGDNVDTHTSIAHDARSMEDFLTNDILPFTAGIEAGAPIVMVAHNIVECMDPDCPASLSSAVHELLRNKLHFDGIIMTDSLDMNAITLYTGDKAAAVAAIQSGNDLLCCSTYQKQVPAVLEAVYEGTITIERIEQSLLKVLQLKIDMGIIE